MALKLFSRKTIAAALLKMEIEAPETLTRLSR